MINHLKKKLFFRYMILIFGVSLLIFAGGYNVYRNIGNSVIAGSLLDYLQEDVFEFKSVANDLSEIPERVAVVSSNKSLHYFSYWFKGEKLVHWEQPNGKIGTVLTNEILKWNGVDGKLAEIKLTIDDVHWSFLLVAQSWVDVHSGKLMRVVVLQNISPYVYVSNRYKFYGLVVVAILCLCSLIVASLLAKNAVKPVIDAFNRQKTFVSDVSHEMKTPLSVLMTYAEILEKKVKTAETDVIKDEVKNMSALIDNLLSLTQFEKSENKLNEDFDAVGVLNEVVKRLNYVHDRAVPVAVSADEKVMVKMDKGHWGRLITILVDNAIKYTSENKNITVFLNVKDGKLRLKVCDEGCGIDSKDLPHIFERFYRADKARSRKNGSFGLGLALAWDIVSLYHGEIKVKSEVNVGTEFLVILPACV